MGGWRRRWGCRCAVRGRGRRVLDRRGGGPGARYAIRRCAGGVGDVRGLGRSLADGVDRLGGAVVDGSVGRRGLRRQGSHRHRPCQCEVPLRGGRVPRGREFVVALRVRPAERSPQLEVTLGPPHPGQRPGRRSPRLRDIPDRRHIGPHTGNPIPRNLKLRVPLGTGHDRPRPADPILRSPQHEVAVGSCRGRCRGVALARPGNPPWPGSAPPFRLRGLPLVHALPTADRPRCAARRPTCGFNQVHAPRSRAPVSGRCWEAWARTSCGGRARRGGRRRTGPGSRTRTSG